MSNELTPYKFLQQKAERFNESRKDTIQASILADKTAGREDIGERANTGNHDYGRQWQFKFHLTGGQREGDLFSLDHYASESFPIKLKPEPNGEQLDITSWDQLDAEIDKILATIP